MSKVITFSRTFPSYHPRKGQPTYFVEKIWNTLFALNGLVMSYKILCDLNPKLSPDILWTFWDSIERGNEEPKGHTIRFGHRFKIGDWFSPRVWSGKPYASKQIIIAPDIQVKKGWDFQANGHFTLNSKNYFGEHEGNHELLERLALNDGLSKYDFMAWFNWFTKQFDGQIICWNENIKY